MVEDKLDKIYARNPQRMVDYKTYSEIISDYNREKDRVTIEEKHIWQQSIGSHPIAA